MSPEFDSYTHINVFLKHLAGGYTVQPVPTPFSTKALNTNKISEGGSNQNEILFSLGKAISGAPQCIGKK